MLLQNVTPKNGISGFVINSLERSGSIVDDSDLASQLIDYYLEITIWSDGTNPLYPQTIKRRLLVSQLTDSCNLGVRSHNPDTVIMILKVHQFLSAVRLVEGQIGDDSAHKPLLLLSVKSEKNNEVVTTVCEIFASVYTTAK